MTEQQQGPVVVATAMTLSERARAHLSEMLGEGYIVVDIKRAPETTNVIITPPLSNMGLSHLRRMFPHARVLMSELLDVEYGADFRGPAFAAMAADVDGYVIAPGLSALTGEIAKQVGLQLEGSTRRTPLALPGETPVTPTPHTTPASGSPVVVWINGAFGAGKTTVARMLVERHPELRLFDPEIVGFALRQVITEPVDDFQSWPAWRALTAETAVQLIEHDGRSLVCPMSLLHQPWANEIISSVELAGIAQRHIVLHADRPTLEARIRADTDEAGALDWRLAHLERYEDALRWMRAATDVIDTTHLTPDEVVRAIEQRLP